MGLSIALDVSLCFIGLVLMWYHVYDVVVGRGVPWEPAKPWPVNLASYHLLQDMSIAVGLSFVGWGYL